MEAGLSSAAIPSAKATPILWKPQLQQINLTTMWGLAICGGLLVLGLFTRLAALGGAALLALFYLSMPPGRASTRHRLPRELILSSTRI